MFIYVPGMNMWEPKLKICIIYNHSKKKEIVRCKSNQITAGEFICLKPENTDQRNQRCKWRDTLCSQIEDST